MVDRILDLNSGMTMVVADLHGDKDAFGRHIGRFLQMRTRHKVERLLLLGDLIHSEGPPEDDESLQMILDVIRMQRMLGKDQVVMLLGNHEMPHIYGISLARGKVEYTPRFEKAMSESGKRDEIIAFLNDLPFYVRTAAGVAFTHAGPDGNALANWDKLRTFDHREVLAEFDHALSLNPNPEQLRALYGQTMGMPYEMLARYYLSVTGPSDARYDHLVRGFMIGQESREFEFLWDALFTRCEISLPMPLYQTLLNRFLETLSKDAPTPQRFLVTGHIPVKGGHKVVTDKHLRIATATHAQPRNAGQHLLLDLGKPVTSMDDLVGKLATLYS